jgi:cytochrome c
MSPARLKIAVTVHPFALDRMCRAVFWRGLMNKNSILLGLAVMLAPTMALADDDAAEGKIVFKKCMACHAADKEQNKVGPYLVGIVGRKAGSIEGFKYSDAMTAKGTEGFVWDEANLALYLKDPKGFIPGNKMAFAGLKKDEDIANVIAYLKADPKP